MKRKSFDSQSSKIRALKFLKINFKLILIPLILISDQLELRDILHTFNLYNSLI